MKHIQIKDILPYGVAVLIFMSISAVYFLPGLQGKRLEMGDITKFRGMSKEIVDYREKTGEDPKWTGAMFAGMPAYMISVEKPGNLIQYVDRLLKVTSVYPINVLFLLMLGFYILLLSFKVDPWLAVVGAIAFAFSSYFFTLFEAGHTSKSLAIAYAPPILAGFNLLLRRKYLLGGSLMALAMALQVYANHYQITYYTGLIIGIWAIFEIVQNVKDKDFSHLTKLAGILAVVVIMAISTNLAAMWSTYEYSKITIRGKAELAEGKAKTGGNDGLEKDYILAWSYGKAETMTLMIPDFKGGASGAIGTEHKDKLKNVTPQYRESIAGMDQYFADQPFQSGPVYVGAIVCFLFLLGAFTLSGPFRWVCLTIALFSITLSWGRHFMWLSDLFIDYFPMYNKFRVVTMILVVFEIIAPLLAFLALDQILKNRELLNSKKKELFLALGLSAGFSLLAWMLPEVFNSFFKEDEYDKLFAQLTQNIPAGQAAGFLGEVELVREAIFKSDAIRSFFFIILGASTIFLYWKKIIQRTAFIALLGGLILVDMWMVDRRYVNNDNFTSKAKFEVPYRANQIDQQILADQDPHYRVFNTTARMDQDFRTPYFHKSLGGYHAAKIRRYQDIIDRHISQNNFKVINMLNAKYVILQGQDRQMQAQVNPGAMGNAWFVNSWKSVNGPDEEIAALNDIDPITEAVVDVPFQDYLQGWNPAPANGDIKLTSYAPNHISYESNAQGEQLAVFSEIYYDKGWNAYIDGNLVPHIRTNYLLRGLRIPDGKHSVDFKFEPTSWAVGDKISLIASLTLIVALLFALYRELRAAAPVEEKGA